MAAVRAEALCVHFGDTAVLRDVHLAIGAGESWALVGSSGSGKTTLGRCLLGHVAPGGRSSGACEVAGVPMLRCDAQTRQAMRGAKIAMILQDALAALDPLQRIGDAIVEVLVHRGGWARGQARDQAVAALDEVKLAAPGDVMRAYPHQLSGGQRQRAQVALALALSPEVVVADEPTSALDSELAAEMCLLLRRACDTRGATLVMITHDLHVAAAACDHVAVLHEGTVVETGPIQKVLGAPQHPATEALVAACAWRG